MPRKAPAPPPPDVVNQIKREVAAPDFLPSLQIWADRQCGKLLSIENQIDPEKARELVHAAVIDTCDGVRSWNPAARPLRRHLEQTINSRLWHECERTRRRRHVSLDTVKGDDSQDENAVPIEMEMSLRQEDRRTRPDGRYAQREVRAAVFRMLRARAVGDVELLSLLATYEDGHVRQDEACARLGWTLKTFVNVHRRFKTIRGHMPAEVRDDAFDVLVRDGGSVESMSVNKGGPIEFQADHPAASDSHDDLPAANSHTDEEEAADEAA